MRTVLLSTLLFALLISCKKNKDDTGDAPASVPIGSPGGGVTDIDGHKYASIVINNQEWMADNLKTSHYSNGDTILSGRNIGDLTGMPSPKHFFYPGKDSLKMNTYGRLYTYYVVNDARNVCPTGWRIPTKADWDTLVAHVGGDTEGGGKLKSTSLWSAPNAGADNLSSFNAVPAGYREVVGTHEQLGKFGGWWTNTADTADRVWTFYLKYSYAYVFEEPSVKKKAYSVRCLR